MNKDNEGLKEVGKGLILFADLFTVLSIVNIYLKDDISDITFVVLSFLIFISLYIAGYKLIKRGSKWVIIF